MRVVPTSRARWAVPVALLLALVADPLAAQRTRMTIAGWPLTAASTSGADFEAGAVQLGATTIGVESRSNNPPLSPRTTGIYVRCVPACPRTGTLPLAGLQWRRDDQVTWTSLTTSDVLIEARQVTHGGLNDPWSRSMQWQYALDWLTTPPSPTAEFWVIFTLVVTPP